MAENAINSTGLRHIWDKILAKLSLKSTPIELTTAQYNALPTSDKNDASKVYYLTDYPSGGGSSGGGSGVSYGYVNPTDSASDGQVYILLDSNNKEKGKFLYITNEWVLISGSEATVEEIKYSYVNTFSAEREYAHKYTAEKAGLYFVYITAAAMGGSSSIQCDGTQKFYDTYAADSNRATKVGVYYCEVGDEINLEMTYSNTSYQDYYVSSVLIAFVSRDEYSVALDGNAGNSTGNVSISSNTTGRKFIAVIASSPSGQNSSVDITINNSSVGLETNTITLNDKKLLCQILSAKVDGTTNTQVGAISQNGGSYATTNAFIFTLL